MKYPTGKIDNSYTQAITEAAFKYEGKNIIICENFNGFLVKKTQFKMMIHDYISTFSPLISPDNF